MINRLKGKTWEYFADTSLFFVALLWGSTFIIIKESLESMSPYLFNFYRFLIASVLLIILSIIFKRKYKRGVIKGGCILGSALFLTFTFQTVGIGLAPASIAGFLTGLNIVFVPILSTVFLKKYPHPMSWVGVCVSLAGLFYITSGSGFSFSKGEIILLLNAFFLAVHVILTDYYSRKFSAFELTTVQMTFIAFASFILILLMDSGNFNFIPDVQNIFALMLTGVFATVVAFFIQTSMQKYTTPTKVAIILSMEPVSAPFFGYFIAGEILKIKQYIGAFLMFSAMIIAETGTSLKWRKKKC
ncbi:DMT family transporter [Flexistipes sp.]|uniref:DMT family transporter n=1 Tax=Flexistipes sp. TaxID=3088135 RepID=UPI002E245FA4|nr:DMT family transporter [Flexistipes sp.]